jgi:signal transduction histidine kinase
MDDQTRIRFGRLLAALSVTAATVAVLILAVLGRWDLLIEEFGLHNAIPAIGLGLIVWVAVGPQPRNGAIWALAFSAFFGALQTLGVAASALYFVGNPELESASLSPSEIPLGPAIALQTVTWTWLPSLFILMTVWLLLFPDGKPLSSRWRWVVWWSIGLMAVSSLAFAWTSRPSGTETFGGETEVSGFIAIGLLAMFLLLPTSVLSAASLIVRYRRSTGIARQQIRWIMWGGSIMVVIVIWLLFGDPSGTSAAGLISLGGEILLIGSIAIAMAKYRLYDIDVVISRTVTYGALALFITAVYVAIVIGVGALFGQGDEPNLALAIAATAVVALLFQPVRSRVQRWANRLVYGERATPYSVLSELTSRLSEAQSNEQALGRLAELIASGTGAEEAVVWLRVGDRLRPEAATSSESPPPVAVEGSELPDLPGDAAESIHHGGELLGALSISKVKADPVTPADRQLLQDVAAGAGLLLRNIQLNAELADRADELRSSRRRMVAAQDAERRRLERNLHDGAQQQVVALKVKLGLAKTLAQREEVDEVADAVADLAEDTQRAVDGMRAAARGIYPPLLEAEGLRTALVALAREASLGVDIEADGIGRYPPEIEATIYFSVLEAIDQSSSGNRVTVAEDDGALSFMIEGANAGAGVAAVSDRMEALGGTLSVESIQGGGTVVVGRLPATALEPA